MPATNVRIAYRPVRVGFLVRAGSLDDITAAARTASLLWGGVYSPVIPVETLEQGQQLVECFRPDVLHPVAADDTLAELVTANPHLAWPLSLNFFDGIAPYKDELPFLDVRPSISAIHSELRHERTSPWARPTWADDEMGPLYSVLFGDYALDNYSDWFVRGLRAAEFDLAQFTPGLTWQRTPLGLTAYALRPPFPPAGMRSDGIVLGDPASAADLALFWNLRAGGVDVAFWANNNAEWLQDTAVIHLEQLKAEPRAEHDRGLELWSTAEWPRPAQLPDKLRAVLGDGDYVLAHLNWRTFHQPLHVPESAAGDEVSVLGVLEDDGYGNAILSVPLPPSPFHGFEPELFHEHLLTRVSLLVDRNDVHTLRLPYLPDLNEWYDREVTVTREGTRVDVGGVSIFTRTRENSLSLRLPPRADIVRRVFARAGVTATPSSAGRALDVVADQLGGLRGARVLRAPGVRELLRSPVWRNWQTARGVIARGRLPDPPRQTPDGVLTKLLDRGALVAGLKLQCPNCRVRERYALDQLGEEMRCPRCRNIFRPTPLLHDSIWEYTASGFFADEGAHGTIPVLLTMMRLAHDTSVDRFIISSHDLRSDGIDCESDLLVLEQHHDGRTSVAVSECKDAGEIDQNDLDNLAAVSERLHASGIECYLIFTTLRDEFTPAELERFRAYRDLLHDQWSYDTSGFEAWRRPGPILFTPRELGQWELYPGNEDDELPHKYPFGLRELAGNSAARYLDKPALESPPAGNEHHGGEGDREHGDAEQDREAQQHVGREDHEQDRKDEDNQDEPDHVSSG